MTSPLSVEEVCKRLQVVIDGLNTLHMHEDWPSNAQCEMWSDHIEQSASLLESTTALKDEFVKSWSKAEDDWAREKVRADKAEAELSAIKAECKEALGETLNTKMIYTGAIEESLAECGLDGLEPLRAKLTALHDKLSKD